jgi:adenylate cyclase
VADADRCTLYLVDNVHRGLFAMQGEVNIRISMDQGIAGQVATTGRTLNITDAYENPNFNQAIDKKTGYRTKAILCMAIKCENIVVGVLQLINKTSDNGVFTLEDEDTMSIFLSIAGPILAASNLYQQIQGKGKAKDGKGGDGKEMPGAASSGSGAQEAAKNAMSALGEGDEDEDED